MNFRQTAVLIAAVFAVVVVLLVITYTADDATPVTDVLTEELAAAKPEDIDSVEIDRDTSGRLKFVRTDAAKNNWEIVEPYRAPADPIAVQAVISALMRAKPTAYKGLSGNPAVHGLDPPSLKVTLHKGSDKASTVNLGDVTIGGRDAVVFVTTSARPGRPMAVPRADLDPLFRDPRGGSKAGDLAKWVADYRVKSVFPGDSRALGEDVASIKLSLPNKQKELALSRTPSGGWKFDSPAGWGEADTDGDPAASANTFTGVTPLLRTLTNLAAGSPADFIEQPKPLKEYGLNPDNPDLVRVEMTTRDGKSAVAFLGKTEAAAAPPPALPGMPPPSGGKVYVRIDGQPGVIRATAGELGGLVPVITDPAPLRDRDLLHVERGKQIDGVDILLAGQPPTKLRRVLPGDWKLYGGPGDPQNANAAAVARVLDVVNAKRAVKGFPPPNPANFAAISATLDVWVDGFKPAADAKGEPVKSGEAVKLEFGRKEGDSVYVRRTRPGGVVNEFLLPAMLKVGAGTETVDVLKAVAQSRLDLLDPSLPTFSPDGVVKVAVSGQANYVLEKDAQPDPYTKEPVWRYAAPPPAGRTADARNLEEMLRLLGTTQSVSRYVDEQPSPAKLTEYGLSPPRLKVVVSVPGGDRVYEFGRDTADPNAVYARVGGKAAVFTLPRLILDKFLTPQLRDRAIFRDLPVARVNRLELKGWGNLLGNSPITLILEKNPAGVWVVPAAAAGAAPNAPAGFAVDPAKVNAFLELLSRTRAKSFEPGPPNAKHGFGDPNQFLEVKVQWPGGAVALNIGATADAGATYYVWSSWLPQTDPVFTVDGPPFKPFKEKPGGFAK